MTSYLPDVWYQCGTALPMTADVLDRFVKRPAVTEWDGDSVGLQRWMPREQRRPLPDNDRHTHLEQWRFDIVANALAEHGALLDYIDDQLSLRDAGGFEISTG